MIYIRRPETPAYSFDFKNLRTLHCNTKPQYEDKRFVENYIRPHTQR